MNQQTRGEADNFNAPRHLGGFGGGIAVKYRSSSEEGAVLLTRGDISRATADAPRVDLTNWMDANAKKILEHRKSECFEDEGTLEVAK